MALTQEQLKWRDFILAVFRKELPASLKTFNRLMEFYSIKENETLDKYGQKLLSSFFSVYKFSSYEEYSQLIELLRNTKYFSSGRSCYNEFSSIIAKKTFDSPNVDSIWIIKHMATLGSFNELSEWHTFREINDFISLIFSREKGKEVEILSKLIDEVIELEQAPTIYNAIIRFCLNREKTTKQLDTVLEKIFSTNAELDIMSIENLFKLIKDVKLKEVVGVFLYSKTNKIEYLPDEIRNMFDFGDQL